MDRATRKVNGKAKRGSQVFFLLINIYIGMILWNYPSFSTAKGKRSTSSVDLRRSAARTRKTTPIWPLLFFLSDRVILYCVMRWGIHLRVPKMASESDEDGFLVFSFDVANNDHETRTQCKQVGTWLQPLHTRTALQSYSWRTIPSETKYD